MLDAFRERVSVGLFRLQKRGCSECLEERDQRVIMEADETHNRRLQAVMPIWECPECGRRVMRGNGEDDEVVLTSPDGEQW